MSLTTINFTFFKNGQPFDPDGVRFNAPDGSYGLKRTDTGQILVVAGTPYVRISTGVYNYPLADPADGLTYDYWREITINGKTYRQHETLNQSVPTALYWNWTQFVNRWGSRNIAAVSNKDKTTTQPNFAAVQDSFDYAIEEIHSAFRGNRYAVPFDFSPWGGAVPAVLSRWGMTIAYADLYDVRGWEDANKVGNKLSKLLGTVYIDMAQYRIGMRQLNASLGTDSTGQALTGGGSAITPLKIYTSPYWFVSQFGAGWAGWTLATPDAAFTWFSNEAFAA